MKSLRSRWVKGKLGGIPMSQVGCIMALVLMLACMICCLQVIAEARKRLLEEHAAKLAGYLPKGVVRTEEEAKIIQQYTS